MVAYRFGNDLYYANAARLRGDLVALTRHGSALRWLVLDSAAIGDIDYAAAALTEAHPGSPGAGHALHLRQRDRPGPPPA